MGENVDSMYLNEGFVGFAFCLFHSCGHVQTANKLHIVLNLFIVIFPTISSSLLH